MSFKHFGELVSITKFGIINCPFILHFLKCNSEAYVPHMTTKLYNKKILISQYRGEVVELRNPVNSRNPAKFTKTHKIMRNSLEIISNTCLRYNNNYETYLRYWGCLLPIHLQIYLETSSKRQANNISQRSLRKYLRKSSKIGRFFCEFFPENPVKFNFFLCNLSKALPNKCLCICENGVLGITYMQMSTITRGPHKKPVRFA